MVLYMSKFVHMFGCLLHNRTETAEQIWMKLDMEVAYTLDLHTGYILSRIHFPFLQDSG